VGRTLAGRLVHRRRPSPLLAQLLQPRLVHSCDLLPVSVLARVQWRMENFSGLDLIGNLENFLV